MKNTFFSLCFLMMHSQIFAQTNAVTISEKLLYAAKTEQATSLFFEELKNISIAKLSQDLANDTQKKAFWINIYNALVLAKLKSNPALYQDRSAFYTTKILEIAGQQISLDIIEHGILRRSKNKFSLGYLGKLFVKDFEQKMRVQQLDYRIHFALNCGAKSCPPIAFYTPSKLDQQLDLATKNYLINVCTLDSAKNEVHLPMIFSWFRGDFKGKSGTISILKNNGIIPQNLNPNIIFDPYNWQIELNNFLEI